MPKAGSSGAGLPHQWVPFSGDQMLWNYILVAIAYVCEYMKDTDLSALNRRLLLRVNYILIKRG